MVEAIQTLAVAYLAGVVSGVLLIFVLLGWLSAKSL